jgi:hypothetical protein
MRRVSLNKIRKVPGMLILGALAIGFLLFPLGTLAASGDSSTTGPVKLTLRAVLGMNDKDKCFNARSSPKLVSEQVGIWGTALGGKRTVKKAAANNNQATAVTELVNGASCTWTMVKDGQKAPFLNGAEALVTSQDSKGNLTVYRILKVGNQIFTIANKGGKLSPLPDNFKIINAQ